MTNPAWPPEKGFPAKPEEEGWHWLQHRTNDTPAPYHWREEDCTGEWRWGGGMHEAIIKKEVVYRGSIRRPAKECGRLIEARFQEGNEKDAQ